MYRDLQEEAIILHPNKIESNEDMKIKSILTGIMAFTLLTGHAQTKKKMMNHNQLTTPTTLSYIFQGLLNNKGYKVTITK